MQNIVGGAKDLLLHASNVQYNRERLSAQIAHIQSTAVIVETRDGDVGASRSGVHDLPAKVPVLATRALDIYAMKTHTGSLRFDTGFIHPDVEEDAYTAFARGESNRALNLMEAYLTS